MKGVSYRGRVLVEIGVYKEILPKENKEIKDISPADISYADVSLINVLIVVNELLSTGFSQSQKLQTACHFFISKHDTSRKHRDRI